MTFSIYFYLFSDLLIIDFLIISSVKEKLWRIDNKLRKEIRGKTSSGRLNESYSMKTFVIIFFYIKLKLLKKQ